MNTDADTRDTLPRFLRDHEKRLVRLENVPRGWVIPEGGENGEVLALDEDGDVTWVDPLPPGGDPNEVLGVIGADIESGPSHGWIGPMWWAWVGTEEEYNRLGRWDDRVLYVIIQEAPGAVTDVTPADLEHTP